MKHYIKYLKTICKGYPAFLIRPSIYLKIPLSVLDSWGDVI